MGHALPTRNRRLYRQPCAGLGPRAAHRAARRLPRGRQRPTLCPNNDTEHYFTVQEDARFASTLRRLALFDFVINNADRKSGHCLVGDDQRLWAIDHGICFHVEYKLRTVIWEFSAERIDDELLSDLHRLYAGVTLEQSHVADELCTLLSGPERAALIDRLQTLLRTQTYPSPQFHRRNYPWPPI